MAKADPKPLPRKKGRVQDLDDLQSLDFTRKNWTLLGSGLAAIVAGFLLLRAGDITLAPILLVGGYLVLIPLALVARPKVEATVERKEP